MDVRGGCILQWLPIVTTHWIRGWHVGSDQKNAAHVTLARFGRLRLWWIEKWSTAWKRMRSLSSSSSTGAWTSPYNEKGRRHPHNQILMGWLQETRGGWAHWLKSQDEEEKWMDLGSSSNLNRARCTSCSGTMCVGSDNDSVCYYCEGGRVLVQVIFHWIH